MKCTKVLPTLIMTLSTLSGTTFAQRSNHGKKGLDMYSYQTLAPKIDFNPFRPIPEPGYHFSLITKSIMGPDGIIEKFHFTPDGLELRAQIRAGLRWAHAEKPVSPKDVAYSIAAQLLYRIPKRGIFVKGTNPNWLDQDWWKKDIEGISIIDERTFVIRFDVESKLENVSGVLRELLERQNTGIRSTFWVGNVSENPGSDFVTNYPIKIINSTYSIEVDGINIELHDAKSPKQDHDFYDHLSDKVIKSPDLYRKDYSINEDAIIVFFNSQKLDQPTRKCLTNVFRSAAQLSSEGQFNLRFAEKHFLQGEPGFQVRDVWIQDKIPNHSSCGSKGELKVLHTFRGKSSERYFEFLRKGIQEHSNFYPRIVEKAESDKPEAFDAYIIALPTINGRQKWIQGAVFNLQLEKLLINTPETFKALEHTSETAASTVPVNIESLRAIEDTTRKEYSIVPLLRLKTGFYSRNGIPFELAHDRKTDFPFFRAIR
jgi:hypothetical protein